MHVPAMSCLMTLWKPTYILPISWLAHASCMCVHMNDVYALAGGCSQSGGQCND